MSDYSIKMPDMSRNIALAGKTVSSKGMNITYDENGYAVKAVNCGHKLFAATERSVRAPSKDAALAGAQRASYGGSAADQAHFSDKELASAAEIRRQVAEGTMSQTTGDYLIEDIRKRYGYSGGASGNEYVALDLPAYPLEGKPSVAAAAAQPATVSAQSVQSAPSPGTAARSASSAEQSMQNTYQAELRQQQQQQTLRAELKEMRTMDRLLKFTEREQVPGALLDMMDRDDEDEEKDE